MPEPGGDVAFRLPHTLGHENAQRGGEFLGALQVGIRVGDDASGETRAVAAHLHQDSPVAQPFQLNRPRKSFRALSAGAVFVVAAA